jgi:hypothetical protein
VGQTPIYGQLCGERRHAEAPIGVADMPRDHPGNHCLAGELPVPAAVFGPPGVDGCSRSE